MYIEMKANTGARFEKPPENGHEFETTSNCSQSELKSLLIDNKMSETLIKRKTNETIESEMNFKKPKGLEKSPQSFGKTSYPSNPKPNWLLAYSGNNTKTTESISSSQSKDREALEERQPLKTVLLKCNECQQFFDTKAKLSAHLKNSHNKTEFECGSCPLKFSTSKGLTKHRRTHDTNHPFKCQFCDKVLTSKLTLEIHVNKEHRHIKPFVCSQCNEGFFANEKLLTHLGSKHKIPVFQCDVCYNDYCYKSNLNSHKYLAHSKPPKTCLPASKPACDQSTRTKSPEEVQVPDSQAKHLGIGAKVDDPVRDSIESAIRKMVETPMESTSGQQNPKIWTNFMQSFVSDDKIFQKKCNSDKELSKMQTISSTCATEETNATKGETCADSSVKNNTGLNGGQELSAESGVQMRNAFEFQCNETEYQCNACEKTFRTQLEVWEHKQHFHFGCTVTKNKYQCNLCPLSYSWDNSLKNHYLTSHGIRIERGLESKPDSLMFDSSSSSDIEWLDKDLINECITTSKASDNESMTATKNLDKESTTVYMTSENQCMIGDKSIHTVITSVSKEVVSCDQCQQTLESELDLEIHVKRAHKSSKAFDCQFCNQQFFAKQNFKKHLFKIHGLSVS